MSNVKDFDGVTYDPALDRNRLTRQLGRVYDLMRDGQWRTLAEIHAMCPKDSEAGISARLRDLRKAKFGGYIVKRRRRKNASNGTWEYQLLSTAENLWETMP